MKIPKKTSNKRSTVTKVPAGETKSILERDIQLLPHKISNKEKETMYRQLSVLQKSGVDIRTAFEILFQQIKKKKTREKLEAVLDELIKGKSLSGALSIYQDFTPYEVYSIKIGEETGRLTLVMEKLTEYFENLIAQRRQLVSALSYPTLIVFTSIGAVTFMIFFIIPMFEEVFSRFGSELPALTDWVIGMSYTLRSNGLYYLVAALLIITLNFLLRKNRKYKMVKEAVILKIPVVGEIYRHVYLARFCDSMALLISSSVPMVNTLEMVKKMIGFLHLEKIIEGIERDLVQGKSLHMAMSAYKLYDHQMLALIKVGEEVNQLGNFFQKLADDYTDGVKHRTSLLSTFLEPLMIIFLGLVVGLILVAMYLPMFELSSSMNFGN